MNYSQIMFPVPLCLEKWGGHDPPAPMGAPPLQICKLVESILSDELVQHLESNKLLNNSQHAFSAQATRVLLISMIHVLSFR